MAYELKITADNFDEFKAQIIALEDMFAATEAPVTDPVMPEVKKAAAKAAKDVQAAADPKPEPKVVEAPVEKQPDPEPEPTKEEAKGEEPAAETGKTLDYQKDVLPVVFKLTEVKGRDAVIKVLETFGVAKASQVAPEKFGEFVEAVQAEITA